jgi:hypothetical protein
VSVRAGEAHEVVVKLHASGITLVVEVRVSVRAGEAHEVVVKPPPSGITLVMPLSAKQDHAYQHPPITLSHLFRLVRFYSRRGYLAQGLVYMADLTAAATIDNPTYGHTDDRRVTDWLANATTFKYSA